jgi:hypothetical protein
MVLADKAPQVGSNLAGRVESCGFRCSFLVFGRDIRAFSVMLQVAKDADGEDVPRGALIADEDKVFRFFDRYCICVFHFAFLVEVGELAG